MLLCYAHHVETNDTAVYPATRLHEIKAAHEVCSQLGDFVVDENALAMIASDMAAYWLRIETLNTIEHSMSELARHIDAAATFFDIMTACRECKERIASFHSALLDADERLDVDFIALLKRRGVDPEMFHDVPYHENPFVNRNWELHNFGLPNNMQELDILFHQLELKYLEEFLKTHADDCGARERLERVKAEFAILAQHAIGID